MHVGGSADGITQHFETRIAQFHTKLIFRARMKAAMTRPASRKLGSLPLFVNADTWVNLKVNHESSPGISKRTNHAKTRHPYNLQTKDLGDAVPDQMSHLAQSFDKTPRSAPPSRPGSEFQCILSSFFFNQ